MVTLFLVTYIGKSKLESKVLNETQFESLARNLKVESYELLRGLEPSFAVKKFERKEPDDCAAELHAHLVEGNGSF